MAFTKGRGPFPALLPSLARHCKRPEPFSTRLRSHETCDCRADAPRRQVHREGPRHPAPRRPAARKATERPSQSSGLPRASRKWPGEGGLARTGGGERGGTSGGGGGGGRDPQVSGGRAGGRASRRVCSPGGRSFRPGLAAAGLGCAAARRPSGPRRRRGSVTGSPPRDLPDGDLHGFPFSFPVLVCPGPSFCPQTAAAPRGPGSKRSQNTRVRKPASSPGPGVLAKAPHLPCGRNRACAGLLTPLPGRPRPGVPPAPAGRAPQDPPAPGRPSSLRACPSAFLVPRVFSVSASVSRLLVFFCISPSWPPRPLHATAAPLCSPKFFRLSSQARASPRREREPM